MNGHTPGPWRFSETWRPPIGHGPHDKERMDADGNIFWGYSISGSNENGAHILPTLAAVHNFPDSMEANARLIASAPNLLETLKDCKTVLCESRRGEDLKTLTDEELGRLWTSLESKVNAAIAKAEPHDLEGGNG